MTAAVAAPTTAPLCFDRVDELAAWNLGEQAGEPACGQHKSNAFSDPAAARQVDGDKRPKAHQQCRQEEVQPIERLQAVGGQQSVSTVEQSDQHRLKEVQIPRYNSVRIIF